MILVSISNSVKKIVSSFISIITKTINLNEFKTNTIKIWNKNNYFKTLEAINGDENWIFFIKNNT